MEGNSTETKPYCVASSISTLRAEKQFEVARSAQQSALQICKVAVWIADETDDPIAVELAAMSALVVTRSEDSEAYRWAEEVCASLTDPEAVGMLPCDSSGPRNDGGVRK